MKIAGSLMLALACAFPIVHAKLPPPTPEEIAAQQQKQVTERAQLEREKALLEQAQDRVAERYRRTQAANPRGRVSDDNMPNNARVLPGEAPPQGGREQSAEAHSAPAK